MVQKTSNPGANTFGPVQGVNYTHQQAEYQYFPEEYFAGSDVTIHFGDVYVDEIMALNFFLSEPVQPVYGYNSYTADRFARGQRIVNGQFTIAFKEAGYLHNIHRHLGKLKYEAKPSLAYDMTGEQKPEWLAGTRETIDEFLDRDAKFEEIEVITSPAPEWTNGEMLSLGISGSRVRELQTLLLREMPIGRGQIRQKARREMGTGWSNAGDNIVKLKERLNAYLYPYYINSFLNVDDQRFDEETEAAVKIFQRNFSRSAQPTGAVDEFTMNLLNRELRVTGTFDAPTKLALMRYQMLRGLSATGELDIPTIETMEVKSKTTIKKQTSSPAEDAYSEYEANIWGQREKFDPLYKNGPHFYRTEDEEWLLDEGYDIFITYGSTYGRIESQGGLNDYGSNPHTTKAIRGVQINSVSQVLDSSGNPIAETYSFIARDID